jgi:uncharacterized protein YllA (UPF0747 family)
MTLATMKANAEKTRKEHSNRLLLKEIAKNLEIPSNLIEKNKKLQKDNYDLREKNTKLKKLVHDLESDIADGEIL